MTRRALYTVALCSFVWPLFTGCAADETDSAEVDQTSSSAAQESDQGWNTRQEITLDSGDKLCLAVADSPELARLGMKERQTIPLQADGILFSFEGYPSTGGGFTMEEVPVPLTLVQIDSTGAVLEVTTMNTCTESCTPHARANGTIYAIEQLTDNSTHWETGSQVTLSQTSC